MKEITYQAEKVSFASGTTARTYRNEFILDSSYERCIGIAVIETKDGGISSYRLGLEDNDKTIISLVHKDFLKSDPAAGMKLENRVLPLNIKAGGHKAKMVTDIPITLTADLEYDVVFVLERERDN